MIKPPKPVEVHPNTTVTFSCLAWSYGGLKYEWNRNDSSVLPSSSTILGCNTDLAISNVQVMDEGLYCCIVSNECGNITKCAWLEVDSKLQGVCVFVEFNIHVVQFNLNLISSITREILRDTHELHMSNICTYHVMCCIACKH